MNKTKSIGLISNFFPPNAYGGYEIAAAQVAQGLKDFGWGINVLTSKEVAHEGKNWIFPWLHSTRDYKVHLENRWNKFIYLIGHEKNNIDQFKRFINLKKPDILFFWNPAYTSNCLLQVAKATGIPTGWFAFDYGLVENYGDLWMQQTQIAPGRFTREIQRLFLKFAGFILKRPNSAKLHLDFIQYPTEYLHDFYLKSQLSAARWDKVSWGVDTRKFTPSQKPQRNKVLFIGQISEHKGIDLLLESFQIIQREAPDLNFELTIAGHAHSKDYLNKTLQKIEDYNLSKKTRYLGFVNRETIADLYREHSILVFPSVWPEPMGITILEAMACGLCIVTSGSGGSRELYKDGITGVTFESCNALDLYTKLCSLLSNPKTALKIGRQAAESINANRRFPSTVAQIHASLEKLL